MKTRYSKMFNFLSLNLIILLLFNCNKEVPYDGYTIKGTTKGVDSGWVKLIQPNLVDRYKTKTIDSAKIQNGQFKLKGKVENVDRVTLQIAEKYNGRFILENSKIKIEMDTANAKRGGVVNLAVTGSKYHDKYVLQETKEDSLMNQQKYESLNALRKEMEEAYKSKDEEIIKKYREKASSFRGLMDARQEEYQKFKVDYVKNNPNSPVSPYVLAFQFSEGRMTKERMKEVYKVFDGEAKKTAMYQHHKKIHTEVFESLGIGSKVPDFTLNTVGGGELTLSKVKGKYILVDFWASWCVPCRASFPHLKQLYGKYKKDGFEVVAVGTSDEEEKWRKAIVEDETPWNHVYDVNPKAQNKGKVAYGSVAKAYGVPFLPTTFLIDENGIVIGRQLRGKDLDAKLEELFGY